MRYVYTLFDYARTPPIPLQSIVVDDEIRFFTFFLPSSGVKIKQIWANQAEFVSIFEQPVCINDFKSHVSTFKLPKHVQYEVSDLGIIKSKEIPLDVVSGQKLLAKIMPDLMRISPEQWRKLLANASVVYQHLEEKGVMHGIKYMPVFYNSDTFTGRSKMTGFNVQGATEDYDIRSVNEMNNTFIHVDWIAADLRMAAFISGDPIMNEDFAQSDPYSKLMQRTSLGLDRDAYKKELLRAIYSLAIDDPILDAYPTFQKWAKKKIHEMRRDGYLTSLLDRKFYIDEKAKPKRDELSVFNSQFQGSVAHAMQATLVRLFDSFQNMLLTEIHDSLILCCPESMASAVIKDVVKVMIDPLRGWVSPSPRMPVRVSVGREWKRWQRLRVYR